MLSVSNILILGCGGFIGSHLLERFLASGSCRVTGVDVASDKINHLPDHPRFRFHPHDLSDIPFIESLIAEADCVILLAAICNPSRYNTEPLRVIESSYDVPARIVRLCAAQKKWLIHFSTSEVYGKTASRVGQNPDLSDNLMDEDETHMILGAVRKQRWTYACAKQLLERLIFACGRESGLPYTMIRPFNFIGPRMDFIPGVDGEGVPRVIACFMQALLFDKPMQLVDGGHHRRVFTYIDDAVDAVVKILAHPENSQGRIFNIGHPDNELSVRDLAVRMTVLYNQLADASIDPAEKIVEVSSRIFYGEGYDDSDRRLPDISLAKDLLGWKPAVGIGEALEKTVAGFLSQYGSLSNGTTKGAKDTKKK